MLLVGDFLVVEDQHGISEQGSAKRGKGLPAVGRACVNSPYLGCDVLFQRDDGHFR